MSTFARDEERRTLIKAHQRQLKREARGRRTRWSELVERALLAQKKLLAATLQSEDVQAHVAAECAAELRSVAAGLERMKQEEDSAS